MRASGDMAALPADEGEAVLDMIMADGTFDDLRQQLVTQLKKDVRRLCSAQVLIIYREVLTALCCTTSYAMQLYQQVAYA